MTRQFDLLKKNGWCEFQFTDASALNTELLSIGIQLGKPVPLRKSVGLVQDLQPISKTRFKNSLTAKYATGEFPLHTDTAHWLTPCRYIVLGCLSEGLRKRETVLVDFKKLKISYEEKLILMSEPFRVTNGRFSFFGTILSQDRQFLRYDPGCMTPTKNRGVEAESIFSKARTEDCKISIDWFEGRVVVIDNWRVLHGREAGSGKGSERIISRVLIE
uniref:Taurine catabolism dioxygenase TauD, TfdA family n=1 Tax=Candidatus Kentrum sp. LFY TaxID=2126342 RepID=A0A450UN01_9GAMM|nr:MAG: Taurine catabolism dioxygenase TauD, TfdA family [Candidatus Kentron sp. LFY]